LYPNLGFFQRNAVSVFEALRAGLNCGQCMGTYERKRVLCSTHPVCRRWIVHTLRKTWRRSKHGSAPISPRSKQTLGTVRQPQLKTIWCLRTVVAPEDGSRLTQRTRSSCGTRLKRPPIKEYLGLIWVLGGMTTIIDQLKNKTQYMTLQAVALLRQLCVYSTLGYSLGDANFASIL